MKTLLFILIGFIFISPTKVEKKADFSNILVATCYGRTPCTACSNCSGCGHCNSGGTCGVCSRPTKNIQGFKSNTGKAAPAKVAEAYTGQCKALTKKGSRCKRRGGSNGYCWQHGK